MGACLGGVCFMFSRSSPQRLPPMAGPAAAGQADPVTVDGGGNVTYEFTTVEELGSVLADGEVPIIILGLMLREDYTPHPALVSRLETGLSAYKSLRSQGLQPRIFVTGGDVISLAMGRDPPPPTARTEAAVMSEWLRDRWEEEGGDIHQFLVEEEPEAENTLRNAFKIIPMLTPGCRTAVLITSEYHMPRSVLCFEKAFAHMQVPMHFLCVGADSGEALAPKCAHEARLLNTVRAWIQHVPGMTMPSSERWEQARRQLHRVVAQP